jgi:TolB protein
MPLNKEDQPRMGLEKQLFRRKSRQSRAIELADDAPHSTAPELDGRRLATSMRAWARMSVLPHAIQHGSMRQTSRVFATVAVAASIMAVASISANARPILAAVSTPGPNRGSVWLLNPANGERVHHLGTGLVHRPLWAPNGRKLVFAKELNRPELWVGTRRSSNVRPLTDNNRFDVWPSWAPNSKRLVLERYDDGSSRINGDLVIVRVNGQERKLTRTDAKETCPAWSPDGSRIAFDIVHPEADILTITPDGSRRRRLTSGPASDHGPLWSPDGKRILFRRVSDSTDQTDLFVMKPNGSEVERLTRTTLSESGYAWSPDGRKIVFWGTPDGFEASLWVMKADGSNRHRVVKELGDPSGVSPTWSRDSRRIAYKREVGDKTDIWMIRSDGSGNHRLSRTDEKLDFHPSWYSTTQECATGY